MSDTLAKNYTKLNIKYQKLKQENEQLKARMKELEAELENYKLCRCVLCTSEYEHGLEQTIDELKHQLHEQPKQIIEKIKNHTLFTFTKCYGDIERVGIFADDLEEFLDNLLKGYKAKDENN